MRRACCPQQRRRQRRPTCLTAPVAIANWRISGIPMIQAYGGMNVYLGNRPAGDGGARARLGGEWDRLEGEASRHAATREEQDHYYVSKALAEISERPVAYAGLLVSKAVWTLQDEELRDTHSYYFFVEQWPLLRWLPTFGWLMGLAVIGISDRLPLRMAGLATIAIGVVFVLLLGEIDLSIGYVSGVAGVIVAELQVPDGSWVIKIGRAHV